MDEVQKYLVKRKDTEGRSEGKNLGWDGSGKEVDRKGQGESREGNAPQTDSEIDSVLIWKSLDAPLGGKCAGLEGGEIKDFATSDLGGCEAREAPFGGGARGQEGT